MSCFSSTAWINVSDFRKFVLHAGTSKEDWIPAIQKAIDKAAGQGGGMVYLPPGTYLIRPNSSGRFLAFSHNITLRGSGPSSIIRIGNDTGDYSTIIGSRGTIRNIQVEDLKFDQNPKGNTTCALWVGDPQRAQFVIYFPDAYNITITEIDFDPCSGINTVWLGGQNTVVSNCSFRFARGRSRERAAYDNSAVYFEGREHKAFGNTFFAEYSDQAFACIETHDGLSTIFGNTSQGYRTGVNIVTAYPVRTKHQGSESQNSNDINVYGNTFSGTCQAIMLWPGSGKTLRNVSITGNTISVNQIEHSSYTPMTYLGISTVFSIETVPGTTTPAVFGDIDMLVISNNIILFQEDAYGDSKADYALSGGILLRHEGNTSNVIIANNLIKNAPSTGIGIGNLDRRTGKKTFNNILIEGNQIVNAGQSQRATNFRAGISIGGDYFRNARILNNNVTNSISLVPYPKSIHFYEKKYLFGLFPSYSYDNCTVRDNFCNGLFDDDERWKRYPGIDVSK